MVYIDKSLRAIEGRDINIRFLKDHFDVNTKKFTIPLDKTAYQKYAKDHRYRDFWRKYICEEQNYLCCYCMRHLTLENFSAEHVIPQSLKGETDRQEFQRYVTEPDAAPNIVAGVEYAADTESRTYAADTDIDTLVKMPHVISHQNLLAACNGLRATAKVCCCNNNRGSDYLVPYMLILDGYKRFKYDVNGIISISPKDSSWTKILRILNGTTLQTIRYIWCKIAHNTNFEDRHFHYDVEEKQRINIFKTAFRKNNFFDIPAQYRAYAGKVVGNGNNYIWNLLVDYCWFLQYYRNRQ